MVPDLGTGRLRRQREGDGQGRRIQSVSLIEEPPRDRLLRDRRLGLAKTACVELVDRHALRGSRRQRRPRATDVFVLERDEQVADGFGVDPDGEGRGRSDVQVHGERGAGHGFEDRIFREHEPPLIPARSARRELVTFDERDARTRAGKLVRACGAHDPATHHRDVRHRRRLARYPVASASSGARIGSRTVNVLPSPGTLSTETVPPR